MYGKFFASTFTGSMFGAGADAFAVWGYVIANTIDSQVELNPHLLAAAIGSTPEKMRAAIDFLCSPDSRSRSKAEDGRRLIREGEFAYRVPNFLTYRAIQNEDDRRAYNREKQREHRAKVKARVNDMSARSAQAEAYAEAEAEAKAESIPALHTARFSEAAHGTAYHQVRARARNPQSFDAMLATLVAPVTGGPSHTWLTVGQALLEMQTAEATPSAAAIRAYCRRLHEDKARPLGRHGGATGDGIDWTQHIAEDGE